jgi:hypothetical protein
MDEIKYSICLVVCVLAGYRPRLELGRDRCFAGLAGFALFQAEIAFFSESNIKGSLQPQRMKYLDKSEPRSNSKCLMIIRYFEGNLHFTQGCSVFEPISYPITQRGTYNSKAVTGKPESANFKSTHFPFFMKRTS